MRLRRRSRGRGFLGCCLLLGALGLGWGVGWAAGARAQERPAAAAAEPRADRALSDRALSDPRALVLAMIGRERIAAEHKDRYIYLSKERSTRTGEHVWTERVVETAVGKVRMVVAEDGTPLNGTRVGAERLRLAEILRDQTAFAKREQALRNDEGHAKDMLELLPRAFLFEHARMEGENERIDYRPNPAYQPQGIEERVLHGMVGSMVVDVKEVRLRRLEGHLATDVSIGFGLLATIRAGSRFLTERKEVEGGEWKTTLIDLDVDGKAIFFKAISKNEHAEHGEFRRVPDALTLAQAVEMVQR